MKPPAWIQILLDSNESLCLDNDRDKAVFATALTRLVQAEREQIVEQIATWLGQRDPQLADMVRRGDWNG